MSLEASESTAEERLRAAFERLKANRPTRLELGTAVSQNNVAREAGVDPSALRKSRYPGLIREIQAYVEIGFHRQKSAREERRHRAAERVSLSERIGELTNQRDLAQAQLLSAQRLVMELLEENERIKRRLDLLEHPPVPLSR